MVPRTFVESPIEVSWTHWREKTQLLLEADIFCLQNLVIRWKVSQLVVPRANAGWTAHNYDRQKRDDFRTCL